MSFESMNNHEGGYLTELWQNYNFPTEVPKNGTEAEMRLTKKAKEYNSFPTDVCEDELAIMVYGSSALEADQVEKLKKFAKEVSELEKEKLAEAA